MGRSGPNKKPTKDDNLKVLRDYQALSRTKKKKVKERVEGKSKERRGNREERKRCRRVHTEQKLRLDAISPILGGFSPPSWTQTMGNPVQIQHLF